MPRLILFWEHVLIAIEAIETRLDAPEWNAVSRWLHHFRARGVVYECSLFSRDRSRYIS